MNRIGYKWNINECLRLQREFELLGLTIDEIAVRNKRTPKAIMFKLDEEGFATYTDLYNGYYGINKFEIAYPLNQRQKLVKKSFQIQLSDSDNDPSDTETLSISDSGSDSDKENASDVGSYYNMRNYIKQLETQVSNLLDYIKQNIVQGTAIESKRYGLPNEL